VLFSTPFSLGQHRMKLEVQDSPYVENRSWTLDDATYVTLNVHWSCNNLCGDNPSPTEFADRNAADLEWLHAAFDAARHRHSAALMIIWQADPGWDDSDVTRAPLRDPKTLAETDGAADGYQDLLLALRDETVAFRRPVALVHTATRTTSARTTSTGSRSPSTPRAARSSPNQSRRACSRSRSRSL
jgi:hypothetical protein